VNGIERGISDWAETPMAAIATAMMDLKIIMGRVEVCEELTIGLARSLCKGKPTYIDSTQLAMS